jgi:pyridoxamine 5'-phosphate oxidase
MTSFDMDRDALGPALDEAYAHADPFHQFSWWFEEARASEPDPSAMALATASQTGRPAVRMVLLKGVDRGFVFYTNYESRKAREIVETGRASLLFFWRSQARQVRIDGRVEEVSAAESDAYFATRPLGSRLSAHASPQSRPLKDRATLDARFEETCQRFPNGQVPRPPWWGGYRVVPDQFEFWQGRVSRLHDRLRYTQQPDGSWQRERLAP